MSSPGSASSRLINAVVIHEVDELDAPHIVICHNTLTGQRTHSGPYGDAHAALLAAEREACELDTFGETVFRYSVAPLYPSTAD